MRRTTPWLGLSIWLYFNVVAHAQGSDFFEKKIRPTLVKNCQGCHNPNMKTAGLDLSSGQGFLQGGQSGALVNKENPEASALLKVISYEDRLKMPPMGKLPAEQLADLETWVKNGASWPGVSAAVVRPAAAVPSRAFTEQEKKYWAFQPVGKPPAPAVEDTQWARSAVDRFVLAKIEQAGLKPAAPAGKLTLLRRATFDLTGLPPTEAEIQEFLKDSTPGAFAKVVDRLLASPRYGERWGRHWLDVARYADSTGNDEDHRYPYAWRYRDYVIESFNSDLPYDQFIREQIAGDLLPAAAGDGVNGRGIVATGFLALGAKAIAQQDKKKMLYDVWDEQVDVVSKSVLGLTMACARCHDHKFDPILTRDYYSMVAFFASTKSFRDPELHVAKLLYTPIAPKLEYEKFKTHQDRATENKLAMEDIIEGEKERYTSELIPKLPAYMLASRRVTKDGLTVKAAVEEKGLREDVLTKWVKFLEPTPGVIQTYLDAWHEATAEQAPKVAADYQAAFEKQLKEWNKSLRQWRARSRRMLKEMNMPPPDKPTFDPTQDRFFQGVYMENNAPFAISRRDEQKIYSPEANRQLAELKKEAAELKKIAPPEPAMACAVEDAETARQHVLIRGDYTSLGEEAPRGFPVLLARASDPKPGSGSGRLALGAWLSSHENPLTARVMVNRIWQKHFVEGIVRTPDNFGKMGQAPTHPELLDWLAARFVASGWSVKTMHRELMLSNAYQMSSLASAKALEADPENKLFSRFPRRRLEIEEIRDGLLAMDGSLDLTMGGTLQSGFGTDGENNAGRLSLNPEKVKRRTVYLPLRRANLPTLLNLYDFGDATSVTGKRTSTNVAPQALFMMNSEFLTERSRNLADALLKDASRAPAMRMEDAYLRIVNRPPLPPEVDSGLTYLAQYRDKMGGSEKDAWQSLCRLLMASNDFIYVD